MEEESAEQTNNRPWLYKKGQSGNPSGRPKGSISMKTWLSNKLSTMDEEEREDFIEGINKIDLFKMAEGNPESKSVALNLNAEVEATEELQTLAKQINEITRSNNRTSITGDGTDSDAVDAEIQG